MSFLFANSSLRAHSTLGLVARYGFCTERRRFGDNKFGNNSVVGKLLAKTSVKDILEVYEESKAQFGSEQYATACRTIGRNLSFDKTKSGALAYESIPQFTEGLDNTIEDMNPSELLDVLFLLRKQKTLHVNIYYPRSRNSIIDKVNMYLREDVYSVRNLIALIFNLSYLGYASYQAVDALLAKIQNPENDMTKDVTVFSASQLIRGLTNNKMILNGKQRRLINEVLAILQKNHQSEIDVSQAINILGSISRINIGDGQPIPFTRKLVEKVQSSFQSMKENDIFMLLKIGEYTNQKIIMRPCLELRRILLDLMKNDNFYFDVSFVIRILTSMSNWLDLHRLSDQQQEIIAKYLQNPNNKLKEYNFVRSQPIFLRLLSRENANTLAHLILANKQGVSISTLAILGRYTDVVPRLIETQLNKQDFSMHELLRIQEIVHTYNKTIPEQLQAVSNRIPQLVRVKLEQGSSWGHIRTFLKQASKGSIARIAEVIKQYVMTLDEPAASKLLRRSDFLFVLAVSMGRSGSHKFNQKLVQLGINQALNRRTLKGLASFVGQNSTPYSLQFWKFCCAVNVRSNNLVSVMDTMLFYKTLKNNEATQAYSNWLIQCLKNQLDIDRQLTNLILMTVECCKIPSINKKILNAFLSNIDKVNKYDKGTVMRLVSEIKREGLLDKQSQTKLLAKFEFIKDLTNYFLNVNNQDDKMFEMLNSKQKEINRNDIERILFADFEKWSHLKDKVMEAIESSEHNYDSTWRNWMSSLRPEMRKNKEYRQVSDLILKKYVSSLETMNLHNQNVGLLKFVQLNNPSLITTSLVEKLVERAKNHRDNVLVDSILDVLSNTGCEDLLDICLVEGQVSKPKIKHIARYNIHVPIDQERVLSQFLTVPSNKIINRQILESLALNDHLPTVNAFLTENKDVIMQNKMPFSSQDYLQSKFNSKVDLSKYGKKTQKDNFLVQKIQQMAKEAGLEFEVNPVVEGVKFDFRIQDKFVLFARQNRFFNLNNYDNRKSSERTDTGLVFVKRVLEKELNKKVLIVPGSSSVFFVLQRQFPQMKIQNTRKKAEETPDVIGADDDVKSNVDQMEDVNPAEDQVENDSFQANQTENANRTQKAK